MKYKSMVCILAFVISDLVGCHSTPATVDTPTHPSPANTMKTPEEAAQKALMSLPQLVQSGNYRGMGFASVDEARAVKLGVAVPRKIVSYDELLKYQPSVSLAQLFTSDEELVYPFQIGDTVKSTTTVSKKAGSWHIGTVGDAYLAKIISAVPDKQTKLQIISIPGLSLDFAGVHEGEDWELVPAQDYPDLDLVKGRSVRAAELLPRLSTYAKAFDKQYGEQLRNRRLVR